MLYFRAVTITPRWIAEVFELRTEGGNHIPPNRRTLRKKYWKHISPRFLKHVLCLEKNVLGTSVVTAGCQIVGPDITRHGYVLDWDSNAMIMAELYSIKIGGIFLRLSVSPDRLELEIPMFPLPSWRIWRYKGARLWPHISQCQADWTPCAPFLLRRTWLG